MRSYHVYKEVWCAAIGDELSCMSYHNLFAVAVMRSDVVVGHVPTSWHKNASLQPLHSLQHIFRCEVLVQEKVSHNKPLCHRSALLSITRFTSALADSIDDDGAYVDRGPHGSGSFAVSLDALK